MTTGAIVALCVGVLLLGLGGTFFIIWFFFRKSQREDDAARQWQQDIMTRIDEVFPDIERLVRDGIKVPMPLARDESAAAAQARRQDDEDALRQREIEASNAASGAAHAAPNLFSGGGGFVQ